MNKNRRLILKYLTSHIIAVLLLALLFILVNVYYLFAFKVPPLKFVQIEHACEYIIPRLESEQTKDLPLALEYAGTSLNATLWLVDTSGNTICGTPPDSYNKNSIKLPLHAEKSQLTSLNVYDGTTRIITIPVQLKGQKAFILIDVSFPALYTFMWDRAHEFFTWPALIALLVAISLGYYRYNRLQHNIDDLANAAKEFACGNYSSRTSISENNDLVELAKTFNNMADSIVHTQQTRRQFFSNASHELKTPLANIQCIAESLQDGIATNENERQQYLADICQQTAKMSQTVNRLLDLERLEAKAPFSKERINVKDLLSSQLKNINPLLKQKGLSFNLQFMSEEYYILADGINLAKAVENILSNAIKWSPLSGNIDIILTESNNQLLLSISDQGPGITEKDIHSIWEPFYQSQHTKNYTAGGTGLGLAIARNLISAMGGTIKLCSNPGQGSTFTISFPIEK